MKRSIITVILLLFIQIGSKATGKGDTTFTETPLVLHTTTGEVSGTLTLPKMSKNIPVALIIAGSGPTDRNGNNPIMKNESLQMLSHGLAGNNIASLRFDKRGIGESKGSGKSEAELRFDDYVADAKEWIALLKKDARFTKLVVIGHSEGSLIGMITAQKGAAGFVSLAGAGKRADLLIKEQLAAQPQQVKDLSFPILDTLAMGMPVQQVNLMLMSLFRPSVQPYMISWFKYDPLLEIKKLATPVLIVQGTNDLQVREEDANGLAKAHSKAQLVLIPNMNHVLKIVEGDQKANIAAYNNPSLPISTEMVNHISAFIKNL